MGGGRTRSGRAIEEVLRGVWHVPLLAQAPGSAGRRPPTVLTRWMEVTPWKMPGPLAPHAVEAEPGNVRRTDLAGGIQPADHEAAAVALPRRASVVDPDGPGTRSIGVQLRGRSPERPGRTIPLVDLHSLGEDVEDELAPFGDTDLLAFAEVHGSTGGDRRLLRGAQRGFVLAPGQRGHGGEGDE